MWELIALLGYVPWLIAIGGIVTILFHRRGIPYVKGPALVLRRIDFRPEAGVIELEGRPGGFISWLLTLLKISTVSLLSINPQVIKLQQGSLWGEVKEYIPLRQVAVVSTGITNRFGFLVAGVLTILMGLYLGISNDRFSTAAIGMVIGAALLLMWYLSRCLTIFFCSTGNTVSGIRVKRSVIEGVALDPSQAAEIVRVVSEWVTYAQHLTYTSLAEQPAQQPAIPSRASTVCPSCGARVEPSWSWCQKCGTKLEAVAVGVP